MGALCTVCPYDICGGAVVRAARGAARHCLPTPRVRARREHRDVYLYIHTNTHVRIDRAVAASLHVFFRQHTQHGPVDDDGAVAVEPRVGARGVGAHREDASRRGAVRERGAR